MYLNDDVLHVVGLLRVQEVPELELVELAVGVLVSNRPSPKVARLHLPEKDDL